MQKGFGHANNVKRKLNMMSTVTVNNGCVKNVNIYMNLQWNAWNVVNPLKIKQILSKKVKWMSYQSKSNKNKRNKGLCYKPKLLQKNKKNL